MNNGMHRGKLHYNHLISVCVWGYIFSDSSDPEAPFQGYPSDMTSTYEADLALTLCDSSVTQDVAYRPVAYRPVAAPSKGQDITMNPVSLPQTDLP